MNRAVFLDRDGTLNVDRDYLYRIEDFEFLPGAVEGLRLLQEAGFLLVVITNQSGIARGYYTEDDFTKLTSWMTGELRRQGVKLAGVYYCPHLPDGAVSEYRMDCPCRKPKTGLFDRAVRELDISLTHSFAVGDRLRDCAVCTPSGCRGFLIGGSAPLPEGIQPATSLLDAARKILRGQGATP